MEYIELANIYERLEKSSKRLEKTFIISEFLKKIPEESLESTMLMLEGRVFPLWDTRKIGVAGKLILKAINKATGFDIYEIEAEFAKTGDLGKVSLEFVKKKKQASLFAKSLTVKKVFENLRKLASIEGSGSVETKIGYIAELLISAKPIEAKYIVRNILEELRVGTASGTLRDSIVWAYFPESGIAYNEEKKEIEVKNREEYNKYVNLVQAAFDMSNDFALVAKKAKCGKIHTIGLKVGIPIKVMLGPREKDAKSALARVGIPCQAEFKYDGFRIQVHKDSEKVTLFTRNLENVTNQFPEVVNYVKKFVTGKSFIIDCEAVGFSAKSGKYLPFQNISQRIRRKHEIIKMSKEFPVELNIFDCIFYNGRNLIKEKFKERRALLEKFVSEEPKKIVLAKFRIVKNEKEVNEFYKESLLMGNEGLMLKKLDSPYKPGARVGYMVKMKETEEPMDLVIIEAEQGEGKRSGWYSSFTLACIDSLGNFVSIGKVGTGIKEKSEGVTFHQLTELLKPLVIGSSGKIIKVKPEIVVEIAFEEIQKSPTYSSGYALRFPRVLRLRNMERNATDITTLKEVKENFFKQKKIN